MSHVQVISQKYDGTPHRRFRGQRLGEDDHGVWIGRPTGTVTTFGAGSARTATQPAVHLIPRDGWWRAAFGLTANIPVYCDVTTVSEWRNGLVTMIDLDLDVLRLADGTVYLDDEEEFIEHQVMYGYPPGVIKAAEAVAQELLEAVRSGDGPFGGAHEHWLAQVQ